MRTGIPIPLVATFFFGPIATMAQLPPEILVDSYLLRVEQAIRDGDRDQARAEIDKVIILQEEQELKPSEEFLFRYAKAAAAVDRREQALESVTKYLTAGGRDSQHYLEALELMNQMQDAIAGRNEVQDVPPGPPASPRTKQGSNEAVPATGGSTDNQNEDEARPDGATLPDEALAACDLWNTEEYFKSASLEYVQTCIEAGTDVTARTEDGHTPLHMAAQFNGDPAVVQSLLAVGADVEARGKEQQTPLHTAALHNENPAVVQTLLVAGADVMALAIHQMTPLHGAALNNENPEVIQMLLGGGAILEARDRYGYTPLLKAAEDGDLAVFEALLTAGANLKARSEFGLTVLHAAVGNDLSVIQAILERGVSARARDSSGETPLHRIWSNQESRPAAVRALLAAGANLEARDEEGNTPLHEAVFYFVTSTAIVALLDAGADAGTKNDAGKTPWDLAQENERLKGSDAYWRLNKARFEESGSGSRRTPARRPSTVRNTNASAAGGPCLIPGYPSPPGGVANLGLPWCPATVGFQARAFALQAAGAQCAIATGISSTPEQIQARRREIKVTCERLAALGVPNCRCP